MTIETTESGDVIIKADESSAEDTVETVLEAATEIADMIDDARKEGEESATKIETVEELLFRVLEGQGFIVTRLDEMRAQIADLHLQGVITQQDIGEIADDISDEIIDEIPVVVDTPPVETEIVIEENDGEINVEAIPDTPAPEVRTKKSRKWI